eukprot:8051553-Heterocapsa_arctica.AAC.1
MSCANRQRSRVAGVPDANRLVGSLLQEGPSLRQQEVLRHTAQFVNVFHVSGRTHQGQLAVMHDRINSGIGRHRASETCEQAKHRC